MRWFASIMVFALCLWLLPGQGISGDQDRYLPQWLELLRTGNAKEKQLALRSLWFLQYEKYRKDPKVFDPIVAALKDKDPVVREAAAAFYTQLKLYIPSDLISLVHDEVPAVRAEAAKALCYREDEQSVDALIKSLHDKDPWVRLNVVYALGELGKKYWSVTTQRIPLPVQLTAVQQDGRRKERKSGIVPGGTIVSGVVPGSPSAGAGGTLRRISGTREKAPQPVETGRHRRKADTRDIAKHPVVEGGSAVSGGVVPDQYYREETTRQLLASSPKLNVSGAIAPMIEILEKDGDWRDVFAQQEVVYAFAKMHVQDEKAIAALMRKYEAAYLKKPIIKSLGILEALQAEQILLKSLDEKDEEIRKAALDALLQLPIKWANRKRENIIRDCKDKLSNPYPEVRIYAVRVLGKAIFKAGESLIISSLRDKNDGVVGTAIEELGKSDDEKFLKDALPFFASENKELRNTSVKAFHQLAERTTKELAHAERQGTKRIVTKINDNLPRHNPHQIHRTASGLLVSELTKGNTLGKISALSILDDYEDEKIEPQLIRLLDDKSLEIRNRSAFLLREYGTEQSVPGLIKALMTSDRSLKINVILALDVIGDKRAKDPLLAMLKDSDETIRYYALNALGKYDDPAVADTALRLIPGEKSGAGFARASATGLMKKRKDTRAVELMLDELHEYWGPSEFSQGEFTGSYSLERFGGLLKEHGLTQDLMTIERLNKKLLSRADLYKEVLHRMQEETRRKNQPMQTPSKRLEALEQRYSKSKREKDLRILNRAVLEEFYPGLCPKKYLAKTGQVVKIMTEVDYLGDIGDKRAVEPILEILENEMKNECGIDDHLKVPLVSALKQLNDQRPVGAFIHMLTCKDTSNPLKEEILKALGSLRAREAVPALREMLKDKSIGIVLRVIRALGEIGDPQALDDIKMKLYQDALVGSYATKAIIQINDERSATILIDYWASTTSLIQDDAILAYVKSLERSKAIRLFLKFSGKVSRTDTRIEKIVGILKTYGTPAIIGELGKYASENDLEIRIGAAVILGEFRDASCFKQLKPFFKDAEPRVRKTAQESMEIIEAHQSWASKETSRIPERTVVALSKKNQRKVSPVWSQLITVKVAGQPMALDDRYLYIGGAGARDHSSNPALDTDWRIEKRSLASGALMSQFGVQGIVTSNATGRIRGIAVDENHIYLCGDDREDRRQRYRWRIEKRRLVNGSLVPEFGTGGSVIVEPKENVDNLLPSAILSTADHIIIAGHWSSNLPRYAAHGRLEKRMKSNGALVPGFGTQGAITIEAQEIQAIVSDVSFIYIAAKDLSLGDADSRWHIEKRSMTDGTLVSSFGLDGIVTTNPSPSNDQVNAMALDGVYIYVVGFNMAPGKNTEWRIEKRKSSDGALVESFGKRGVITSNRGHGYIWPLNVVIDSHSPGTMYVVGRASSGREGDMQWCVEKRQTSDGSLTTDFGEGGIMIYNPSDRYEGAVGIAVSESSLYVIGEDNSQLKPNSFNSGQWKLLKIRK